MDSFQHYETSMEWFYLVWGHLRTSCQRCPGDVQLPNASCVMTGRNNSPIKLNVLTAVCPQQVDNNIRFDCILVSHQSDLIYRFIPSVACSVMWSGMNVHRPLFGDSHVFDGWKETLPVRVPSIIVQWPRFFKTKNKNNNNKKKKIPVDMHTFIFWVFYAFKCGKNIKTSSESVGSN